MRNVVSFKKTKQRLASPAEENTINPNALKLSSLTGAAMAIISAYRDSMGGDPVGNMEKAAPR